MRSWIGIFARILPLAAVIVCGVSTDAQADLFACFSALAPLDQAAKAAEIAAKAGACTSDAVGDPAMAMTIAALTAAEIGGAFSTTDQCNGLINGEVGRLVATALLQLPLPDDAKRMLADFANGTTPLSFEEIVAAFQPLAAVPFYIHCGCAVAGAPGEYAKIASDYAHTWSSCGSFVSDAVNTFLNGAQSVGESIHEFLNGTPKVPGIQMEQTCYPPEVLPDGLWTASQIYINPPLVCNVIILTCAPGHVVVSKTDASGKTLRACEAKCPDPVQSFEPGGSCYYTTGYKPVDGICTPEATGTCCGTGQKVTSWGVCSPACQPGVELWDTKADRCTRCAIGFHPVYQSSDSSVGTCAPCPAGQDCSPVLIPPTMTTPITVCPIGTQLINGICTTVAPAPPSLVPPKSGPLTPPVPMIPPPVRMTPQTFQTAPPAIQAMPPPVQTPPQLLRCPSGTMPNATGTACVASAPIQAPRIVILPKLVAPRNPAPATPPPPTMMSPAPAPTPLLIPHITIVPQR
jgi:hypothetical protein